MIGWSRRATESRARKKAWFDTLTPEEKAKYKASRDEENAQVEKALIGFIGFLVIVFLIACLHGCSGKAQAITNGKVIVPQGDIGWAETIQLIASLCQTNGGTSGYTSLVFQRDCQAELAQCVEKNLYDGRLEHALWTCVSNYHLDH